MSHRFALRHVLGFVIVGIFVGIFMTLALVGCASTPKHDAVSEAKVAKLTVDGLGTAYLEYCEIVLRPKCMDEDRSASEAGTPQTKAQRVSCLGRCASSVAAPIRDGVDGVRTAQTALFLLLKGDPTPEELSAARAQVRRSAQQLSDLLRSSGVMQLLQDTLGGP